MGQISETRGAKTELDFPELPAYLRCTRVYVCVCGRGDVGGKAEVLNKHQDFNRTTP